MKKPFLRFIQKPWIVTAAMILSIIGRRFIRDRFTYSASALTYTTLLSLVPITTVVLGILSLSPQVQALGNAFQSFVFQNFVPATGEMVQQYLNDFVSQAGKLPITGFIVLIVLVVLMILTVERTFNDIWRIQYHSRGLASRTRFWVIVILTPFLAVLSIAIVTYLISIPIVATVLSYTGLQAVIALLIPFLLTLVGLTVVYGLVPNCRVPVKNAFFGAIVAAILLQLAKFLFFLYITSFPTYRLLYGALATIPIFLLWIYLTWVIILLGALISHVLTVHSYQQKTSSSSAFATAIIWLEQLWQAQQQGKVLSVLDLYETASTKHGITPELQLQVMIDTGFIKMLSRSQVLLAKDLDQYTLANLYHDLPWQVSGEGLPEKDNLLSKKLSNLSRLVSEQLGNESVLSPLSS